MNHERESGVLGGTSMVETFVLSWSGDKDSAMAFRELSHDPRYKIQSLRGVGFEPTISSPE